MVGEALIATILVVLKIVVETDIVMKEYAIVKKVISVIYAIIHHAKTNVIITECVKMMVNVNVKKVMMGNNANKESV